MCVTRKNAEWPTDLICKQNNGILPIFQVNHSGILAARQRIFCPLIGFLYVQTSFFLEWYLRKNELEQMVSAISYYVVH